MPTTFANTIDGNPIYAQRAEQDASGNNIAQTYATKSELPSVPVTDVTVDGVSVVSSGTAAIVMPTIPVTDVEVDGSSVVNASGVAEITLPTFTQAQADWTEADSSDPSYIQNKPTLATVATSGSYNDLTDTPTIPSVPVTDVTVDGVSVVSNGTAAIVMPTIPVTDVEVDGTSVLNAQGVAEITMPTIPVTDVEVDGTSVLNAHGVAEITMPTIPVTDVEVDGTSVLNAQGVAEITMPSIPVTDVEVDGTSVLNAQGVAEITLPTFTQVQADWTESDNSDPSYIQNKPTLAAVATSGDYSDLSGTPTINNVPAVTSSDDSKVLKASYSGGVGSYSWETESAGGVTDVEVDGTSVVSGGVASITMPTELVPTVTSSDDGKVLTATYSGGTGSYAWAAAQGGTTYTAGNMISLANDAVAVSTTAGITDIQVVNALPASPVATVLYLIPSA